MLTNFLLVYEFIAEMVIGVFGAAIFSNHCHPRGDLIEDPDLSNVDSRSDTSGMTN